MFQNLLVPLDGSNFGECALAYAESLATKYQSQITLLHVISNTWEAELRAERPGEEEAMQEAELQDATGYLQAQEKRLREAGLRVTAVIVKGEPIHRLIFQTVKSEKVDTIIMSTHGFTGLKRLIFGNVAEKVIQKSPVPVLLVRPPEA